MRIWDKLKDCELEIKLQKSKLAIFLVFGIGTGIMALCSEEPIHIWGVLAGVVMCLMLSCINIKLPDIWYEIGVELLMMFGALSCYLVMEVIYDSGHPLYWWNVLINTLPLYLFVKTVYLLTKKLTLSVFISLVISYIFAVAAYYVFLFRGTPLLPWDIMAIGTAATVADNFVYMIKAVFVYALVICAIVVLLTMVLEGKKKEKKYHWKYTIIQTTVIVVGIIFYAVGIYPKVEGNLWDPHEMYTGRGLFAGFLAHIRYCKSDTISGYSYEEVEKQIKDAEVLEVGGVEAENIIVIMNEAFSDLRVINDEIISDEYMPFIDSLEENTIKGNLYVPVFGGQTCDTEFEVLLGASTQYTSVTPYQSLMRRDAESLVSYLKEEGYYAQAFHPYPASNWNRDKAYGYMGFDEFLDIKAVEEMEYEGSYILRKYCSDEADYYKIIQEYEENNDGKYFMFNVTMQNHSGYEKQYEDLPITVDLSSYGEYPLAEQYLTLIKKSDEAFEGLIEYFSQVEEPTLICMFGDHMPKIESEFYTLLYGKEEEELTESEKQQKYVTPVIIWANYDIEEKYLEKISSNFLAIEILKAANLDIEGYWSLLNDVYEEYPVLTKSGTIDAEGNYYLTDEMKEEELIRLQRSIQYYRLMQE